MIQRLMHATIECATIECARSTAAADPRSRAPEAFLGESAPALPALTVRESRRHCPVMHPPINCGRINNRSKSCWR